MFPQAPPRKLFWRSRIPTTRLYPGVLVALQTNAASLYISTCCNVTLHVDIAVNVALGGINNKFAHGLNVYVSIYPPDILGRSGA